MYLLMKYSLFKFTVQWSSTLNFIILNTNINKKKHTHTYCNTANTNKQLGLYRTHNKYNLMTEFQLHIVYSELEFSNTKLTCEKEK